MTPAVRTILFASEILGAFCFLGWLFVPAGRTAPAATRPLVAMTVPIALAHGALGVLLLWRSRQFDPKTLYSLNYGKVALGGAGLALLLAYLILEFARWRTARQSTPALPNPALQRTPTAGDAGRVGDAHPPQ